MRRVLVSGAGGFIGGRLVRRLASDGWDVWALSRRARPDEGRLRWTVADLGTGTLPETLPQQIDAVVHLAQSEHFRDFPDAAREIWDVSATATQRLLEYALAAGARNAVVASTGGLYGAADVPVTEETPADAPGGALSFYFAAKRASELVARSYGDLLAVATMRFFFVYGAGQREAMLMPRLVRSVRDGRPLRLQGTDGIRMNPIHVDDAVAAVTAALDLPGSMLFNIAGPEAATLRQIGTTIGRALGTEVRFDIEPDARPGHLVADIALMRRHLIAPQIRLSEGIAELAGSGGAAA